jgi:MFS family permease
VAYFQSTLVLPLAVTGAGLPPSAYGIVAAANGLVIVVLQPFTARITTRLDPSRTIAVSLAIAGVGFWLTTFATSTWTFVACTLVWTLGEIGVSGHLPSLVSELADPAARGRYLGLFGFAFGLAIFLAPLLGPPLYQSHGAGWVWLACFVLFCSAAAGHLAIRTTVMRRRAQQRAAAPA